MNAKLNRLQTIGMVAAIMLVLTVLATTTQSQTWSGPDGNNNIYYNSGNVGIGTSSPASTLHVLGNNASSSMLQVRNQSTSAGNSRGLFIAAGTNSSDYVLALRDAGDNDLVRVTGVGNVGIGTISPSAKLHISNNCEGLRLSATNDTTPTWIQFNTSSFSGLGYFGVEGSTAGTFLPGTLAYATAISSGASGTALQLGSAGSVKMTILSGGNVGIGTTTPGAKLSVITPDNSLNQIEFGIAGQGRGALYRPDDTNGIYLYSAIPAGANKPIHFRTGGTSTDERLTILGGGNVGIGTTNPGYKLDVNGNTNVTGNVTVSGNISAKYQDVAEWVESSEKLAAGTVVVLDSTKSNQVISSSQPYDTRVAGVISAQPGITLGEKGDSKVLVATTGRVKVKVDATKLPIHIGDLLVTSDVPGVAMKSEPVEFAGRKMHMPGTLIGKALEPLAKGSGEILVLLSLQ